MLCMSVNTLAKMNVFSSRKDIERRVECWKGKFKWVFREASQVLISGRGHRLRLAMKELAPDR